MPHSADPTKHREYQEQRARYEKRKKKKKKPKGTVARGIAKVATQGRTLDKLLKQM